MKSRHLSALVYAAFVLVVAIAKGPEAGGFILVLFLGREFYSWIETRNDLDAARKEMEDDGVTPLPCPACGFLTLADRYGSHFVCSICRWEDDPDQLGNPTSVDGANRRSLAAAQADALARFPATVLLHQDHERAGSWRPLNAAEIAVFESYPATRRGVRKESDAYWLKGVTSEREPE